MALKWEKVPEQGRSSVYSQTERAKIPGGWLVRTSLGEGSGVTFVPDPDHKWDGNSLD